MTTQWAATFGIKQGRGGWLVTEQKLLEASDYWTAHKVARRLCPRGEAVMSVDSVPVDKDLLDYDDIDVI